MLCMSRVAPDYAADLSVPILDRGRNAKEKEIGSSTMCRPNYLYIIWVAGRDINDLLLMEWCVPYHTNPPSWFRPKLVYLTHKTIVYITKETLYVALFTCLFFYDVYQCWGAGPFFHRLLAPAHFKKCLTALT